MKLLKNTAALSAGIKDRMNTLSHPPHKGEGDREGPFYPPMGWSRMLHRFLISRAMRLPHPPPSLRGRRLPRVVSPLAGEMAGRPEGSFR